jgi:hypothetical protein
MSRSSQWAVSLASGVSTQSVLNDTCEARMLLWEPHWLIQVELP